MARIPEYSRRVLLNRANPSNIELSAAANGGNAAAQSRANAATLDRGARAAISFGTQLSNEQIQQKKAEGQMKAQQEMNRIERENIALYDQRKLERQANPTGFTQDFDDFLENQLTEYEDSINAEETNIDMDYFRSRFDTYRTSTKEKSQNWETGLRVQNTVVGAEKNIDDMNINFAMQRPRLSDLPRQLEDMRDFVNTAGANTLSPAQNAQLYQYGTDKATLAVMDSMLETDPKTLNHVLNYGSGGQNAIIDFVMFELEGGDKLHADNDGGQTKFGINKNHNPDVNVAGLTADEARKIYRDRYWDDSLKKYPMDFAAVAFDARVNHGQKKGDELIRKADGDPFKLLQLRQQEYARLVATGKPKYTVAARGWERRINELTEYVSNLRGGGNEFLNHASMLDPDILMRVRGQLPASLAAKDREQEAQTKKMVADYQSDYKSLYDAMMTEYEPVGQDEINTLQEKAIQTGVPEIIDQAKALENTRTFVTTLKGLGTDQLNKVVRQLSAENNKAPSPETRIQLDIAETVRKNQIEGIKNEGLAYYGRTDQIRMPEPINYTDPSQSYAELLRRQSSSLIVETATGDKLPVLTPDEITQLQDIKRDAPANEVAGILQQFNALEPPVKARLAQSIDDKDPILATAMQIEDFQTKRRLLNGEKIEGKVAEADMAAEIAAIFDPMVVDPTFKNNASKAVTAYYNALSQEARDFSPTVNAARMRQAVEEVYAPIVDISFFGTENVFSFKDPDTNDWLSEDDMYDMFNGITDSELKSLFGELPRGAYGEEITANDIYEDARILSSGDGLYNITFDEIGGVYDANGNLLEIDGRQLLQLYRKRK